MKWELRDPAFGDMIRIKSGSIYHYGIYVSDDEVIQFGLAPGRRAHLKDCEIEVLVSDIDAFLTGSFLEVAVFDRKERKKNRSPKQTVAYARAALGKRGYNILYNNCEHFAYECVTGTPYSSQTATVRELFRTMPVVDVYVASIPREGTLGTVVPQARNEAIARVSNERVRREKYYVWKLLEYALQRSFGLKIADLEFACTEGGRWSTPACEFSLSHTENAVAVAVSRAKVGVDLETPRAVRVEGMARRILTAREQTAFEALEASAQADYLIQCWTAKEAIFKSRHETVFEPAKIEVEAERVRSAELEIGGERYWYSVATDTPERIRLYTGIELS